ncbi:LuxR C-terminal-related transcriptional regulator [Roseovarius tibetensis]|uniref:LuxR C-terminal-related transcriptional regulator n=1 Tax=Roseovarius tibetensis TaxID=2685897 RepID=UPI003D7F73D8
MIQDRVEKPSRNPVSTEVSSALIVASDEYFRIAIRHLLREFVYVGKTVEAGSLDDAIAQLGSALGIELALLDLQMPGMDVTSAIRSIRNNFPTVRVAVVSDLKSRTDVLRCLNAGAHGFVYKGMGAQQLAEALKKISRGTVFVPSFLTDLNLNDERPDPERHDVNCSEPDPSYSITPRQYEVLNLLVKGFTNKVIARELSLSEGAVKFHLSALFRRLGARNRVEAATNGSKLLLTHSEFTEYESRRHATMISASGIE